MNRNGSNFHHLTRMIKWVAQEPGDASWSLNHGTRGSMWSEWQSSPANPIWSRSQLCPSSASCANECQRFAAFFRCSPFRLALCLGPWIKTTKDPAISKSIFGVVSLDDGNVGISRKSLNHLKSINAIIRLSFFFYIVPLVYHQWSDATQPCLDRHLEDSIPINWGRIEVLPRCQQWVV